MKKFLKIRLLKGETLLEVVIALFVIVIGSATAANLIITSLRANVYNRDSLIALNLAQEGIEMIRNLRDSNWMKFSSNTQNCWNMAPNNTNCSDAQRLKAGFYNSSGTLLAGGDFNLADGIDSNDAKYQLKYYDTDINYDSNGDGDKTNDKDRITIMDLPLPANWKDLGPTKYFRSFNLAYKTLDAATGGPAADSDEKDGDMMLVTCRVSWQDSGVVHDIVLNTALTRYK